MSKKTVSIFCQGTIVIPFLSLCPFQLTAAPYFLAFLSLSFEIAAADDKQWWPESDVANINEINEGRLEFLVQPPDAAVHHHHNAITISKSTLRDGWVRLEQCHDHLDPVGRAEIVFRKGHVRNLSIVRQAGIGKAWISDQKVQLTNIARSSYLCLSAETKAMEVEDAGQYVLRNGPFMRRFLDGYYPMRVTMRVRYPCGTLEFFKINPHPQPGFRVTRGDCAVAIEALFEGRLQTEIRFRPLSSPGQPHKVKP